MSALRYSFTPHTDLCLPQILVSKRNQTTKQEVLWDIKDITGRHPQGRMGENAKEMQNRCQCYDDDAGAICMVDLIAEMKSDAEQQESCLDNLGRVLDACVAHNNASAAENDWEKRHSCCAPFPRFESHIRCPLKPSAYLERMYLYTSCSPCNVVVGFIFLQRLRTRHGLCLTPFNIQRYLLTASMLASKTFDDVHVSNKQWGLVGEIEAKDMLLLELDMLGALDFSMTVHREEYDACVSALEDLCDDDFAQDRDLRNWLPIVLAEDDGYHEIPPALFHAAVVNRMANSEGLTKVHEMGEGDDESSSSPRSSDAFSRSSSSWEKESLQSSSPSPENVARDKVHVPAGPACENEPECNRYLDMSSHAYILYV